MRAYRLTRSKMPLCTASVLELFHKIDGKYPFINYEPISDLYPSNGELFLIEGLDSSILDGKAYTGSSEIFHEERFDVIIDRTKDLPRMFRFLYINRASHYRVAHYLICEKKTQQIPQQIPQQRPKVSSTVTDTICNNFLSEYAFIQGILFKNPSENPSDRLDSSFWRDLVARHIGYI